MNNSDADWPTWRDALAEELGCSPDSLDGDSNVMALLYDGGASVREAADMIKSDAW